MRFSTRGLSRPVGRKGDAGRDYVSARYENCSELTNLCVLFHELRFVLLHLDGFFRVAGNLGYPVDAVGDSSQNAVHCSGGCAAVIGSDGRRVLTNQRSREVRFARVLV